MNQNNNKPEKAVKKSRGTVTENAQGFSAEEQAAMKERAKELKTAGRTNKVDAESEVLAKIEEMAEPDRSMAMRLHTLIKASATGLSPKLWYGMPAYAIEGKVVCFFQGGQKFKTRYSTLGFSDTANLDEDVMWPVAYALKELSEPVETKIIALIQKAIS
ncbi:MAG: DUF1801 domain-containing protein [Chloroflexota bacterium]